MNVRPSTAYGWGERVSFTFFFCLSDSATRLELTSADIAIRLWNVSAESEWEWEVKREMKTKRNLSLNAASRVDTRCRESRAIEKWNLNKLRNTTALTLNLLKLCRESSESKFESQSQWDAGTLLAALGEINEHTRQDSQRPTVRPHGMAWKFNSMRLFFVWSRLSTLFFPFSPFRVYPRALSQQAAVQASQSHRVLNFM